MLEISKEFTFDMAHRLALHSGKCKNLHGHSYRLQVFLSSEKNSQGMIADFAEIKNMVKKEILSLLDHSTAIWSKDEMLMKAIPECFKRTVLPFETTAENLAEWIFVTLEKNEPRISKVILWETPASQAIYTR
ncbi:MAG TPA: 6-carboxytetrahydropterin synthase QueD [Candidatus Marinimicrobia bacterium]|nr:6-carboxytetrahydropterin synthase QueD [Candidatus Neomarinimicrobiota bacterium]